MKTWSIHITTIAGTEVRIHLTFLLLLAWVGWAAGTQGGLGAALGTVAFIVAIFFCVLLHEFGHVAAARRYGILTPDITLLPIGGVARLERMPRQPSQELVVAIAGPLVNVAIAGLLLLATRAGPVIDLSFDPGQGSFARRLMQWNVLMVAFNMVPAFPMDGGRVLRAALAMLTDYGRATRIAAAIGQGIAAMGFVLALFVFHPILLLIAMFIFLSAGQEAAMVGEEEAIRGLRVRDAMLTEFHSLTEDARLDEAVAALLKGSQHDFPVLNAEGRLRGMLTRNGLIGALAEHGRDYPVRKAIEAPAEALDPGRDLGEAMRMLRGSSLPALPVLDSSERLVGMLTTENIGELLLVRAAMGREAAQSR